MGGAQANHVRARLSHYGRWQRVRDRGAKVRSEVMEGRQDGDVSSSDVSSFTSSHHHHLTR
jgi:hypothetical protein